VASLPLHAAHVAEPGRALRPRPVEGLRSGQQDLRRQGHRGYQPGRGLCLGPRLPPHDPPHFPPEAVPPREAGVLLAQHVSLLGDIPDFAGARGHSPGVSQLRFDRLPHIRLRAAFFVVLQQNVGAGLRVQEGLHWFGLLW